MIGNIFLPIKVPLTAFHEFHQDDGVSLCRRLSVELLTLKTPKIKECLPSLAVEIRLPGNV